MNIRLATDQDFSGWLRLRKMLWPRCPDNEHKAEMTVWLNNDEKECLVALKDDKVIGFIELSLRSVVDGCESSPVAFVEGWYVDTDFRSKGIGRSLLATAETWARDMGCTEMGSDTEIGDKDSILIHRALGFKVVGRVVQLKKRIV